MAHGLPRPHFVTAVPVNSCRYARRTLVEPHRHAPSAAGTKWMPDEMSRWPPAVCTVVGGAARGAGIGAGAIMV